VGISSITLFQTERKREICGKVFVYIFKNVCLLLHHETQNLPMALGEDILYRISSTGQKKNVK